MRKKGLRPLIGLVVVTIGLVLATVLAGHKPNLGLDLQGGVSVVLQPFADGKKQTTVSQETLDQTKAIIETRVNAIGVGEPDITVQGSTIVVQLPGRKDQKRVLDLVGKTAELRFRPVLVSPQAPPPADAKETIAELRKELNIPEGVTARQIVEQEIPATTTIDPNAVPADPNAAPVDPNAVPVDSIAPSTAAPTTIGQDGSGTGGKNSAKSLAARRQATTTTTPEGSTTTVAPTTTTPAPTTTVPTVPKNQWGIDISTEKFGELYQLEDAVASFEAELTQPEDDVADKEVTLLGVEEEDGTKPKYKLGPTLLTGRAVETASAGLVDGQWLVNPTLKDGKDGIDLFNAAAATCNAGAAECPPTAPSDTGGSVGALAVVLDGTVISAPAINAAQFQRDQIQISGNFTEQSAKDLALALRYGSLPVELEPQTVQTVSATLGAGALDAGLIAGAVGLGVVMLYILLYYRLLGLVTIGSLIVSGGLLWVIIANLGEWQGLTLSLAGIVGIVVSVGVSLDSSVVYIETLKEEVRRGRSLRSMVDRSFEGAYSTIVKAGVSSLIGAVILYVLSIGPVKGFAFFLAVSTVLDMLMAYFFVRPAASLLVRSSLGSRPALFGIPVDVPPATPGATAAKPAAASGVGAAVAAPEPEPDPDPEPEPDPAPEDDDVSSEGSDDTKGGDPA